MTIGPAEWTIAGIVVLVLTGIAFLFWIVRAVMGRQRGRTIYVLPDPDPDKDDDDDEHDGLESR
jgi:hypothetical protein